MSFSKDVKQELVRVQTAARHCQLAELAGVIRMLDLMPSESVPEEERGLELGFEYEDTAKKVFTLLKQAFNINVIWLEQRSRAGRTTQYVVAVSGKEDAAMIRKAMGHPSLLKQECCRKALLRGAFLAAGSLSAPEKYYHFEIVCPTEETAALIQNTMKSLGVEGRTVIRKKDHVVYLKEGDTIVYMLGAMGATISFLNIENIRVTKEMRGNINRQVNCEAANMRRTAVTAVRQINDIRFLRDHVGFGNLSAPLRQMAEVRLAHPEASLIELGEHLEPRIGKSGVNHRLRKLSEVAGEARIKMNIAEPDES